MICDHCRRDVPRAPGYFHVTVPHADLGAEVEMPAPGILGQHGLRVTRLLPGQPCAGNGNRRERDDFIHPATRLAQQWAILDDDAYWEGL